MLVELCYTTIVAQNFLLIHQFYMIKLCCGQICCLYRLQDFMLPPSKKPRVIKLLPDSDTMHCRSSSIPANVQNRLSQDILLDHVKFLYLFQCFQEAQDNKLCKALHKTFREGCITLEHQVLHPHYVASLALFLLKSNNKWKSLNLASCHLGDEGLSNLHHYLCVKPLKSTVEEFDISDNNLTEASLSLLIDVINWLQPSCLKLSDNCIRSVGLQQVCSKASTIKKLWVEAIDITLNKEVIFTMMSSLNELFIDGNELYDKGAELLSEGLANTSSLKILSISCCNISTKGAKALASSLSKNTSLEILNLRSNYIDDDGAVALADVLINSNKSLTELNLLESIFGFIGIEALQDMAKNKHSFVLHLDPIASIQCYYELVYMLICICACVRCLY